MLALLMGDMRQWDTWMVLVGCGALLVLPWSLLRLDRYLDLVGCTGAVFCPGPSVVVVGLDLELGPDLLPDVADASKYAPGVLFTPWPSLRQPCSSWWPSVKWQSSKLSLLSSLTPALSSFQTFASLTVVDIIVAPVLEGVDGKVKVLPVVVTKLLLPQRGPR